MLGFFPLYCYLAEARGVSSPKKVRGSEQIFFDGEQ